MIEQTGSGIDEGSFPLKIFNDQDIYDAELRRIFARSWVYLGHMSEIEQPGDYVRRYIGEDPYILTRDETGQIQAFLDSCMHRGAQFCTADKGNTSHFRCPYHGWTYSNDGTLQGMPKKAEAYQGLDPEDVELESAYLDTFKGLIFGRIVDEGPSLEEYLGDFKWYLELILDPTEKGMTVVTDAHRWQANHNWKTSADNFGGDNYHVFATHQAAEETDDLDRGPWKKLPDNRRGEFNHLACTDNAAVSYQITNDRETYMGYPDDITEHFNSDLSEEQTELFRRSLFYFGTIFPNTTVVHAVQSGGWGGPWAAIRKWQPRGPGEVEVISWWLVPEEYEDNDAFMERSHRGWESLSAGGAFESDDLTIWEGISESTKSMTLDIRESKGNMQQGMDGMSDEVEILEDPMHGPGEVTTNGGFYDERGTRTLLSSWYEQMSREETGANSGEQ
ncbi:aromatic ring-hydroxylating oxygenase subunit alpha [Halorientalis sp.]|jgi:phenylpropionate dioxygenase-like ring-hydroxylating dioxygenase large terminal subunit|uniref:aromatic ring-hydroxylating oxygenase subunit alpha n=1 Tax=Halorientalis sp. TaxID=1931229 RepID=UPI00260511DD|nr:aromatic ring-hydroxylating dioxygenase subunit alpha [Halorientalis sp.]